jgi:hypothetical protein
MVLNPATAISEIIYSKVLITYQLAENQPSINEFFCNPANGGMNFVLNLPLLFRTS